MAGRNATRTMVSAGCAWLSSAASASPICPSSLQGIVQVGVALLSVVAAHGSDAWPCVVLLIAAT